MTSFSHPIALSTPVARSIAIAALMGATMLAYPMTAARADSTTSAQSSAATTKAESVEQRISTLHASLKITPDEDSKWNAVAQSMRDNAAAMQKLAADKTTQAPQSMTAVQDLKAYQAYAQAHVDGLKNLSSSFETLYNAMPDAQKKVADGVFQTFGRERPARG
jgi:periplasmic protein CpxP/Spy